MSKKEHIFNTALILFVENGFHGTPTSKIAKEAGVANGTLFHYFKTKEDLIIELYLFLKMNMKGTSLNKASNEDSFKNAFKILYLDFVYGIKDNPLCFKFISQFKASPYYLKLQKEHLNDGSSEFVQFFQNAINSGEIRAIDINLTFVLISNIVNGLTQYIEMSNLSKAEEHNVITESFNMTWKMIE